MVMIRCVLVTGGAGYIGSHCVVEMLNAGIHTVVVDNLSNAGQESLKRIEDITGKKVPFYFIDLLDKAALSRVFKKHKFDAVVHLAGLKAVHASVQIPLTYYDNNLTGTLHLLQCMKDHRVHSLVFSSSATVYGKPQFLPYTEEHPTGACINPYGKSKYFIEEMLKDLCHIEKEWNAISLRYFNPIGAHKSGKIGEDPKGIPCNLMPFISQVAIGKRPYLNVFGNDYDTPDGTAVRDYIHVVDLAMGHLAALWKVTESCGWKAYNLGTGTGYSVLEIVEAMEKAAGKKIPYKFVDRRPGDLPRFYADPSLAERDLKWKATMTLDEMCEDSWRWQTQNPNGYDSTP